MTPAADAPTPPAPMPPPPGPPALRWALFRALEMLSDLRGNVAAQGGEIEAPAAPQPALWIYVSTIGELNAVQPLLRQVVQALPQLRPVLITEHPHYRAAYEARYPQASVCVTRGHSRDAALLAQRFPPRLLLVAEIPCLPSDAPCRLSHAFVRTARRAGARVVLANGWLYHYTPASRMDALERRWFERDYLRAFHLLCMQHESGRQRLLAAGADPAALVVTGNIKFDALPPAAPDPAAVAQAAHSPALLASVLQSGRPTVVAGCLTRDDETLRVLQAFGPLRAAHPAALLVLAPRHPEVPRNMAWLRQALAERGLAAEYRSQLQGRPLPGQPAVLVLDTMGDLRDFYAAATVAHVGVDHNVLEPLAFGKPVTVGPGWNATYPSYPVYTLLAEAGALLQAESEAALAAHWLACLGDGGTRERQAARARQALAAAAGATARHLAALQPHLAALQPR
ncbi:MAG: hypothetical protein IPI51_20495 [Betaproteobacteria bacterium]|nr:hypothetical protein [Betaproteobacteria bacterium]